MSFSGLMIAVLAAACIYFAYRARMNRQAADAAAVAIVAQQEDPKTVAELNEADAGWASRIKQLMDNRSDDPPQVSQEEAQRFRTFIALKHAVRVAQADRRPGSKFTPTDLKEGIARCEEKAAAAAALLPSLKAAHDLWSAEVERTGQKACSAGHHVKELSTQYEDLAFDGGDLNSFLHALAWRQAKSRILGGQGGNTSAGA